MLIQGTKIDWKVPCNSNIETDSGPIQWGMSSEATQWFIVHWILYPITAFVSPHQLLYLDDLKLFALTNNQLEQMVNIAEQLFKDIGILIGLDINVVSQKNQRQIQRKEYDIANRQNIEAVGTDNYLDLKQAPIIK